MGIAATIILSTAISFLISKEWIFKWWRNLKWKPFLKKLWSCPNCLSIWVSFFMSLYAGCDILLSVAITYLITSIISAYRSNNEFTIQ